MDNIIAQLRETDEAALFIIRAVLEARTSSVSTKLVDLKVQSELCKGYALLAALADAILAEKEAAKSEEITVVTNYKAMFESGLSHG